MSRNPNSQFPQDLTVKLGGSETLVVLSGNLATD